MKMLALVLVLVGCVRLPHVDPRHRTPFEERRTIVTIEVTCAEDDPFFSVHSDVPVGVPDQITWYPPRRATGVAISERHVLTAAHAVACPVIPLVMATLWDGRQLRMVVERDDLAFPHDETHPTDVARLVVASAEYLGLGVPPPLLWAYDVQAPTSLDACATLPRGLACGVVRSDPTLIGGMTTRPGDSGAPVYTDAGVLLGLVSAGADDGSFTRITPVGGYWLEGT